MATVMNAKKEESFLPLSEERDSLLGESYSTEYSTFEIARPKTTGRRGCAFPDVSIERNDSRFIGHARRLTQRLTDSDGSSEGLEVLRTVAGGDPAQNAGPVKPLTMNAVVKGAETEKEDVMRDDADQEPSACHCSLIPSWLFYQCEYSAESRAIGSKSFGAFSPGTIESI